MKEILENYGRYLLLQARLPKLAQEKEDTRRKAMAADWEKSQKKVEWECWKAPGFFQRLLGKTEEKKDAAYYAYQQAAAACRSAEQAAAAYEQAKAEMDGLAGIEEQYANLPKTQAEKLLAVDALGSAALYHLDAVLFALNQALSWEEQERNIGGRMPNQDDGMWEQLAAAREPAKGLKEILEQFPEPDSWLCDYLRNPDGFIYDGVIMMVSPRNKIRIAIGQLEKLKIRLQ